jgi:hypothetical protein
MAHGGNNQTSWFAGSTVGGTTGLRCDQRADLQLTGETTVFASIVADRRERRSDVGVSSVTRVIPSGRISLGHKV